MKQVLLAGILAAILAVSACGADPDTTVSDSDVKQESITDSAKSEKAEESRKTADKKKDTEKSTAAKKDSKEDSQKKESEKESAKTETAKETATKSSSKSDKTASGQNPGNQNASGASSGANTGSQLVQPSSPSGNGGASKPSQPETPAHTHNYSKSVTDATCTNNGKITYTCSCGEEYSETIPALGHDYQASITAQASCGNAGTKTFTCSRCNDSYTENIPATGDHSWEDIYEDHWHDPVTEERPVYESHAVCNQCGMDFGTGEAANDAAGNHTLTSQNCENYSVKRVQTGTEQVTIQEGYTSHDYVRTECSVCHTVQ